MSKTPKPYPAAYEERLCLFLDILGFKNHVDESAKEEDKSKKSVSRPMTVARLYGALDAIDKAMKFTVDGLGFDTTKAVTQFSDSIVVSYKLDEVSAVFDMLYDIHLLQINLIQRGILVRGAITSGQLIHDERLVFGPALNEAVEFEKLAMYPRVILSQEIIELGKSRHAKHHSSTDEEKSIMSLLKQDLDGMFYIDYFSVSPGEFDEEWDGLYNHMVELRELIKRMSQLTRNPSIKIKHSWMRHKFNDVALALEKSKYRRLGDFYVPEDLEDHIRNLAPFR
jgi:hypothetical protein